MPLGEFELIRRYFTRESVNAVLGIGDDAALLPVSPGKVLVVSTDMLVSGRHFFPDADPFLLGRKSLAVNLSDIAAMGAQPRWATLSLALPSADEAWLAPFADGFFSIADEFQMELVGGDTTKGPLNICVQIMGETDPGKALRRDGARVGDFIWVSGDLGGAALALRHLHRDIVLPTVNFSRCAARLHNPMPRVALGLALRGIASGAIDISDGLIGDLSHILSRSSVAGEIRLSDIPSNGDLHMLDNESWARQALLAGGDDYELCFTAPSNQSDVIQEISKRLDLRLTPIGKIVSGSGLIVRDANDSALNLDFNAFDHFR
jgi:thiamine-monophosphate kinase